MLGEGVQHAKAIVATGVTGTIISTAWLSDIDTILKLVLSIVGILTGIYSTLYYRQKYKEGKNAEH